MTPERPDVFAPAKLGPVSLRNRVIKAATFEGRSPRGEVTDDLVAFHVEVARGGVGMTTVAYCAVSPGGRIDRHTIVLDRSAVPGLRRLTEAVHAEGAAVSAQIGHAGLMSNVPSTRVPALAPSTRLSLAARSVVRGASVSDLDDVRAQFADAARCAREAGFDAIEIHMGHNYLLSSFLSPNLNRRTDAYGGTVEKRARFPREVAQGVRSAVGSDLAVTAKLNMDDGVRGGLWLDGSIPTAKLLEADGALDALQLTGGSSLLNAMYFFRGDVPLESFIAAQPRLAGLGVRLLHRRLLPHYPFEEAFFLPLARQFREAVSMPLTLLGGINRLDTMHRAMAEGFQFVAMARALLREPDLVNRFRHEAATEGLCIHCNECMPTIYSGTRCVLREPVSR